MRELGDWEIVQAEFRESVEGIFEKKGWTSGRDEFFRNLVIEAMSHPPGAMRQRLETIGELMQKRYHIAKEDRLDLERDVFREIMFFYSRSAREISAQMDLFVEMNRKGQLFDAEVVAKLAQLTVKLRPSRQRLAKGILESVRRRVPEGYRQTFEQDYKHIIEKRLPEVYSMEDNWARGQWTPADWGLENHPLYVENPLRLKLPSVRPGNPSSWAKYVEAFIRKFELEDAQQVTAWSVLRDLEPKAKQLASAAQVDLPDAADPAPKVLVKEAKVVAEEEASAPDPIDQLFDQFLGRLETIPTELQRQRVALATAESSEKTPQLKGQPVDRPQLQKPGKPNRNAR